jgi:hypothetical protein
MTFTRKILTLSTDGFCFNLTLPDPISPSAENTTASFATSTLTLEDKQSLLSISNSLLYIYIYIYNILYLIH